MAHVKKLVWTPIFDPFQFPFEGIVIISTEMMLSEETIPIGEGFSVHEVASPMGINFMIESISGGIISGSVAHAQQSVGRFCSSAVKLEVLQETLRKCRIEGIRAKNLPVKKFWEVLHVM